MEVQSEPQSQSPSLVQPLPLRPPKKRFDRDASKGTLADGWRNGIARTLETEGDTVSVILPVAWQPKGG